MTGFPTRAPAELEERATARRWLVDELWSEQGVGIVGGEPKCGKSMLALDLAVAVAAGVPCLRRFDATEPGPVLLFAAEDAGHIVRARLQGICHAAGADFDKLPIAVIDIPVLRLDHAGDRRRLLETVERIGPRLLILDPFVRLHHVDENAVAEVAPILGFLRAIQRRCATAVLLVHHARKGGASRPGQALRGSSELHAWGDSNLYLRRRERRIFMTVEHRAAPGLERIDLELADHGNGPALRARDPADATVAIDPPGVEQRIVDALRQSREPLSKARIRTLVRARNERVGAAIEALAQNGTLEPVARGCWRLASRSRSPATPGSDGNGNGNGLPLPGR